MKIYLGADHGGYELKGVLTKHLKAKGYEVEDVGAHTYDALDGYPQYAYALTAKLLGGDDDDLGILICKSGQGMCIAANRVRGIRAGIAWSEDTAIHARRDDNVNVLVLAPSYTDQDTCVAAVDAWLSTEFSKNPKYQARLDQIEELYG
ncbi:MAG TPA: RpiB/LacA/LacB family sugar-phosphate isomerase [Candidatus Saccharimonadia bacterium]|jgi:ribose 5-phosphate isomerase B|nr:RpiB/LacA/LacB family sugar-phosphate isomerase [Candidatus Saccharimonadia bacterium]